MTALLDQPTRASAADDVSAALRDAKFSIPPARRTFLSRERLVDLVLGRGKGHRAPITVVSAPIGTGKSTAVAAAARALPAGGVAWCALDADDADPLVFGQSVLHGVLGAVTFGDIDRVRAVHAPSRDALDQATQLAGAGRDLLLVLDNVQELPTTAHAATLARLANHLPSNVALVLVAHHDPDLPKRLRSATEIREIRAADLAFTATDVCDLYAHNGIAVSDTDARALTSWTAGSPAALHLAVAAVHAGTDMDRVLYEARRVDRPAHDMLLREVLAQQDAEARRFVLATAVTDVCNATLAAAICDMSLPDATRLMGELVAQDLFLEPIRGTSGWFRHHSLYADLLRAVLCHEAPGAVEPLYRRAARWFDAHGCPERAFPCAVAGREWDLVVDLVAHRWIDAAVDGDRCDVYSLREMPDAVASRSAEHLLAACILDLECQRPDDARRRLERVTISRPAPSWHTPLVHDVLTLRLACVDGVPATIDAAAHTLTESAVDPALPADLAERVAALALQGAAVAALATGDTRRAAALFQDAAASSVAGDARNVTTTAWLALTAALAGRMHVAAAINDELAAGWAPAQSDAVKVLRGLTSAICAYHDDRLPSAQQAIADVRAHMTPNACASTVLHAVRARIAASTGDQESAARHLRRAAVTGPAGLLRLVESAVGLPGEGASTATFAHPYDLVLGAIDVAVTQHALGALDAAWTALERALAIAARNGYRRFVVDSGLPVLPVLSSYVVHARPHRAFALELFERMRCDDGSERSGSVETLTERELTVLRYLPTMLSNREIALEMFFSINTVKTHLKSIYRKLDVDRRRDAVDRARALSLI